jgi:hypothetical protein
MTAYGTIRHYLQEDYQIFQKPNPPLLLPSFKLEEADRLIEDLARLQILLMLQDSGGDNITIDSLKEILEKRVAEAKIKELSDSLQIQKMNEVE